MAGAKLRPGDAAVIEPKSPDVSSRESRLGEADSQLKHGTTRSVARGTQITKEAQGRKMGSVEALPPRSDA